MIATEESRRNRHYFVGTEQLLLGLIGERTGVAAKVLKSLGVNLKNSRIEVEKIIGRGSNFDEKDFPFTKRAKRVLKLTSEEARQLGHSYVCTQHLLLGLIRLRSGVAAKVLKSLGVNSTKLRSEVLKKIKKGDPDLNPQAKQCDTSINLKNKKDKEEQSDKEIDNREDNDLVSQLESLASLKREGLLTNKEFDEAKRRLLF